MEYKIMQGVWGEKLDTLWDFFIADTLPEDIPASAVMGIPFWRGKIALVRTKRGWEIPGGHIEEGESISSCLARELMEEVGAGSIESVRLFGYRKITNPDRKINAVVGKKYPRNTIVPYYLVDLGSEPTGANAEDCLDSGLFNAADALVAESHDRDLIVLGVTAKLKFNK